MKFRLLAVILCGFLLLTKAAQVSLTPEFWAWTRTAGRALLESPAVKFLIIVCGFLFLASLIAAGFDRAAKRRARWEAEQARARAIREEQIRKSLTYQFSKPTDRGPWAA